MYIFKVFAHFVVKIHFVKTLVFQGLNCPTPGHPDHPSHHPHHSGQSHHPDILVTSFVVELKDMPLHSEGINTIKDGGRIALYAVETVFTIQTALHS